MYTGDNDANYDDPRNLWNANSKWYGDADKIAKDQTGNPILDPKTGKIRRIIDKSCKFDKFQILGANMARSLRL